MSAATPSPTATRHRPKSLTVFAAAFIAGAAAAVGVNRVLDVHLAQRRPQVECERMTSRLLLRSLAAWSGLSFGIPERLCGTRAYQVPRRLDTTFVAHPAVR